MNVQRIFFTLLFVFSITVASAQLEDGNYEGFKKNKGSDERELISIEVKSLGNGISIFRENGDTKTPLNGTYHIIQRKNHYYVGNFSKGKANGTFEAYGYSKLIMKATYSNGSLNGKVIDYSKENERNEYIYKDGVIMESAAYYNNDKIKTKRSYVNGGSDGFVKEYDENGKLIGEYNSANGWPEGKQMEINSRGEKKIWELKKGLNVGSYSLTAANGNILEKGQYDDNSRKTGHWIFGNENGKLSHESDYKNSKLDGEQKTYFAESGKLRSIEHYKDGVLNGSYVEYYESPYHVRVETNYVDGRLNGESKIYDTNGTLIRECTWKNDGITREKMYKNGKPYFVVVLGADGQYFFTERYDESGNLIKPKTPEKTEAPKKGRESKKPTLKEDKSGIIDIE